ncbi:MAG: hypothetical protein AAGA68_07150 [Pseudomonadota bacterium]
MRQQLFDRESERTRVNQLVKRGCFSSGAALWIEGESGVGKSQLLEYTVNLLSNVLEFDGNVKFHKCGEDDTNSEFALVLRLLDSFHRTIPKTLRRSVTREFDALKGTAMLTAIKTLVPEIALVDWTAHVLNDPSNALGSAHEITTHQIVGRRLQTMLTNVLHKCFVKRFEQAYSVIAIQDVSRLDRSSLNVLVSLATKLRSSDFRLSLVVDTRPKRSARDQNRYNEVERGVKGSFTPFEVLPVGAISNEVTVQYLEHVNRGDLLGLAEGIHSYTRGNFEDLTQASKLPLAELEREILGSVAEDSRRPYLASASPTPRNGTLSIRRLDLLVNSEAGAAGAFCLLILYAFDQNVSKPFLEYLLSQLHTQHAVVSYGQQPVEQLLELERTSIVSVIGNRVFAHDRKLESLERIKNDSPLLRSLIDITCSSLLQDAAKQGFIRHQSATEATLKLKLLAGDSHAFTYLTSSTLDAVEATLQTPRVLTVLSPAFARASSPSKHHQLVSIATKALLRSVELGLFSSARDFGDFLYLRSRLVERDQLFHVLLGYCKALKECETPERRSLPSGITVGQRLMSLPDLTPSETADSYLLYGSILEHAGKFEDLDFVYDELPKLAQAVPSIERRQDLMAQYYRSLGITRFHGEIVDKYALGVEQARSLVNRYGAKYLRLLGTCLNMAGLGAVYAGQLMMADKYFEQAIDTLSKCSFDNVAPFNNWGVAALLRDDLDRAADLFARAATVQYASNRSHLVISLNTSLLYWKTGREEEACKLAESVVDQLTQHTLAIDAAVHAWAAKTLAYFKMELKDYAEAARLYGISLRTRFRFREEQQREVARTLRDYCLFRSGGISGGHIDDFNKKVDLAESLPNALTRPYALPLIATRVS